MTSRVLCRDLPQHIGQRVIVRGWLNNVRAFGKLAFLVLRDRTGFIQIVIEEAKERDKLDALHPGSILTVEGTVTSSPDQATQLEIAQPHIQVVHAIREAPPIEYYKNEIRSDLECILDHRPIALRNRKIQAIFRIQAEIAHAYRAYMHNIVEATEYFPPNLLSATSEGGTECFHVDYFGYTATLAQSSQLYKQMMVGVNERVFGLIPFFRAEPSHTTRHLAEGKQFEFEMGFFENWHEILDIQEGVIKAIVSHLETYCAEELALLGNPLIRCPQEVPIPRLTFAQAQELYYQRTGQDERHEPDLSPAAERALCQWANDTLGIDLVFVTDWQTSKRPFYAFPNEQNPSLTNTFDLLCGGVEITSGGQRRHTYESMLEGLRQKEMDPTQFEDYLSIFRYGMPPHGGFGMGLERITMTLLKLPNIREVALFPSDMKRIAGNRIKAKMFFGSETIRNEIIRRLREKDMTFQHLTHEPTPTSQDAARVRGSLMEQGVKALILQGKTTKKNYQFNIPAHLKLDMPACNAAVGEKCEFEKPEVILERYGLSVGGIPPFGNLLQLDNYFDDRILEQPSLHFNCGMQTESISMESKDLVAISDAKIGRFAK